MKKLMNLTTNYYDLLRYSSNEDLKNNYRKFGLDGIEVMVAGIDRKEIIKNDDVIGVHLKYFYYLVCLWNEDAAKTLAEYDSWDTCRDIFGGTGRDAIIKVYKQNLNFALKYKPEYTVFHISDVSMQNSITRDFSYTDIDVVNAVIDLVNTVFPEYDLGVTLLFENLWWPGLTLEKPELVEYLINGIKYPNCGVMLDIVHLFNTNTSIRTVDDGIDHVYRVLSKYGNLDFIKGIHLHQTLSGEYADSVLNEPFPISGSYFERFGLVFPHIMKLDAHRPIISNRVSAPVKHINLEYLVLEFITSSREEHERFLREQINCLPQFFRQSKLSSV